MDYTLPADLWDKVIPLAALVGAVAGFVWDIGNAIRRSADDPATGLDNIITLPRGSAGADGSRNLDLGFIGPMLVGAMAGILLVLLAGRSAPGAEETASAISQVSEAVGGTGTSDQAETIAESNLGTQVTAYALFLFAALGGLAGWPLLQAMTTRTSKLVEAAVGVAFEPASRSAKEAVQQTAESLNISDDDKQKLADAAEQAVQKSAPAALRSQG